MTVVGKSSDLLRSQVQNSLLSLLCHGQVVCQVRLVRVEVQIVPQDLVNSPVAEIKSMTDGPDGNCLVS